MRHVLSFDLDYFLIILQKSVGFSLFTQNKVGFTWEDGCKAGVVRSYYYRAEEAGHIRGLRDVQKGNLALLIDRTRYRTTLNEAAN